MAAMSDHPDHSRYLESSSLYTTLLDAFTKAVIERPKCEYLELWVAIFLLGKTKTAKRVELADGTAFLLSQALQGNFQDVLTSGSSSLRDQGWVKNKGGAASSPETTHSNQFLESNIELCDAKSHSSKDSNREYLKNSDLYKTLLDALKQVTLGRPKHQELWVALFLLGKSKTATSVEFADGTVLVLKPVIQVKSKDLIASSFTSTLRNQGWTAATKSDVAPHAGKALDQMSEHSALVFDCDPRETRAIRLEFKETSDGTQLSLQVQSVAPAILSFLGSPGPTTIRETKPYQDMMKKAQNANTRTPINKYFLKSKETVKNDYTINANDFIAWILEQKDSRRVNKVVLGCTEWYHRASGEVLEKANKIIKRLTQNDVFCTKLQTREESLYEAASVAYATHTAGTGQVDSIIDVDAGHLEYMYKMETLVKMDCGWQMGSSALRGMYEKVQNAEAALQVADNYVNSEVMTNQLKGRVGHEIEKAVQDNKDIVDTSGRLVKQNGTVLCITEMEETIDIGHGKGQFAETVPGTVCVKRLKEQVNALEAEAKKNPVDFFSSQATSTLVKLKLKIKMLETFFDLDTTRLLFKNVWDLPGGGRFFATWTAGWYLKYLNRLGIDFDGSKDVLKVLEEDHEEVESRQVKKRVKLEDYVSLIKNLGFIEKATSRANALKKHSALVFDCGSGETKAILLTFNLGTINFTEVAIAPAVLSFLGVPGPFKITDTRQFQELQKHARENGEKAPAITKFFLKNKPPVAADYVLTPEDFIVWVLEQQGDYNANYVLIHSSSWDHVENADKILSALTKNGLFHKKMNEGEEALYEAASVSYVAAYLGIKNVEAMIASGAGFVNYVQDMRTPIRLECGYRNGRSAMRAAYAESQNIEAALRAADAYIDTHVVHGQINNAIDLAATKQLTVNKKSFIKQSGTVVCIAGCYYAAKAAGIENKDDELIPISMADCMEKFKTTVTSLEAEARKNPSHFMASTSIVDLVNLKMQMKLLETFFKPEAELIFKRNWELEAGAPFRTTWSTGWYLQHLLDLDLYFRGAEAVRNILNQEAPISEDSALIFDCGSGETKAIKLEYSDTGTEEIVSLKQVSIAPAVLSFLQSPKPFTISDTKPFQDLIAKAKKGGKPAPAITKYFLQDQEPVEPDYTIDADDFVEWVVEQRSLTKVNTVMIATSAWHRVADSDFGVSDPADNLVHRLTKLGIKCKMLHHKEESFFEAVSVAYAARASGVDEIDAVIGSGGGSVQFMYRMRTPILLNCGWRLGRTAMEEEYERTQDIEAVLQVLTDYIDGEIGKHEYSGRVENEIKTAIASFKGKSFYDRGSIIMQGGTVICISACCFAAAAAGIKNEDNEMIPISMSDCMKKFKITVTRLEKNARENPVRFMASRDIVDLVNLKMQIKLFQTFFKSNTQLIFKRNWQLPGNVRFRTTWSAGWYLQRLQELGVYFDGTRKMLQSLRDEVPVCDDNALVFDCGSGETKSIYLEYSHSGSNEVITTKQVSVAPAVLSFLQSPKPFTISDTKPFQDLIAKAKKEGKPAPAITKYFLQDQEPVEPHYTIDADDFVEWVVEQQEETKANTVMIATSAWHRAADSDFGVSDPADNLVHRLTQIGINCKQLSHTEESYFEAVSVAYAARASGIEEINAVIGSGGGSVQFMYRMRTPIMLNCGWRLGQTAMKEEYERTQDIEAVLQVLNDYINSNEKRGNVCGRLPKEIQKATSLCGDKDLKDGKKLKGTIVCISACYYAAMAVGIENKDQEVNAITLSECLKKFKDEVASLEAEARKNPGQFMASRRLMNIVNLNMQIKLFETFFETGSLLIFKRNWRLAGNAPFRTTWSSGYFMSQLARKGIDMPGTKTILQNLKKMQKKYNSILRRRSFNLMQINTDRVGMVLVSFPNAVAHIREVAGQIGEVVTPILQMIAKKYGGHMEGLAYHIKGEESLQRKLIAKVIEASKLHKGKSSFCPNLTECMASIHDALRYTIVFPPETYTEGIKAVEDILMDGIGKKRFSFEGIGKKFKAKNSWQHGDNLTTYMGVNGQVTVKHVTQKDEEGNEKIIPMSENYCFEVQFHTPGSFKLKMEDSHLFYEALRDDEVTRGTIPPLPKGRNYPSDAKLITDTNTFKTELYKGLKVMWNTKDDDGNPKKPGQSYHGIEFEPFKPWDMSIVEYRGRMTSENLSKFELKQWNSGKNSELYESKWVHRSKLIDKYEFLLAAASN